MSSSRQPSQQIILLAQLFAIAGIFHFHHLGLHSDPWGVARMVTLIALALFPQFLFLEVTIVGLLGAYFFEVSFGQSFFLLFVCLIAHLLFRLIELFFPRTRNHEEENSAYVSQTFWGITTVIYGFAFFQKLNWAFLSPETSPAKSFVPFFLPALTSPNTIQHFFIPILILLTLIIEGGLAFLITTRKYPRATLVTGLLFHFILGLFRAYAFSALMIPLIITSTYPHARWLTPVRANVPLKICAGILIFFAAWAYPTLNQHFWHAVWFFYGIGACYTFLQPPWVASESAPTSKGALRFVSYAFVFFLLLMGFGPHFGYRGTPLSFSMYSGLQTGAFKSNHLLIPGWVQLSAFQGDLLSVQAVTDPTLAQYIRSPGLFPRIFIQAIVERIPDERIDSCTITVLQNQTPKIIPCQRFKDRLGWKSWFLFPKLLQFIPITDR